MESFYPAKYLFTVDYSESEIADDPAQHKQSHVMYLLDAGEWTGNMVALPNNRVRVTHPAWFETGEGPPDFLPSQHIHYSKSNLDYTLDVNRIFDNLYNESDNGSKEKRPKGRNRKKNLKVAEGDYTQMKIQRILLELSLQLQLMLVQQWQRLKKLTNHLLEKFKY